LPVFVALLRTVDAVTVSVLILLGVGKTSPVQKPADYRIDMVGI